MAEKLSEKARLEAMSEIVSGLVPEEAPETAPEESEWKYGNLYWGVATGRGRPTSRMYLEADSVEVTPNGDLVFTGEKGPLFIAAAGRWCSAWAASTSDGTPVAVHKTEKIE